MSESLTQFDLTANELTRAKSDPKFLLSVVTNALSDHVTVYDYTPKQLLESFEFRPLSYMAVPKN